MRSPSQAPPLLRSSAFRRRRYTPDRCAATGLETRVSRLERDERQRDKHLESQSLVSPLKSPDSSLKPPKKFLHYSIFTIQYSIYLSPQAPAQQQIAVSPPLPTGNDAVLLLIVGCCNRNGIVCYRLSAETVPLPRRILRKHPSQPINMRNHLSPKDQRLAWPVISQWVLSKEAQCQP